MDRLSDPTVLYCTSSPWQTYYRQLLRFMAHIHTHESDTERQRPECAGYEKMYRGGKWRNLKMTDQILRLAMQLTELYSACRGLMYAVLKYVAGYFEIRWMKACWLSFMTVIIGWRAIQWVRTRSSVYAWPVHRIDLMVSSHFAKFPSRRIPNLP